MQHLSSSLSLTTSTKATPYTYLVQRCAPLLSAVGYVQLLVLVAPLTELTTTWLDNVVDGVPLGDVTGCSLSVTVPRHRSLGNRHSTTVVHGGVTFSESTV